ncbi:unnamed protein product [Ceratitis capitata]|uniref:(Mediterranean fruit fly) hypothetical protein n=1 Tax=Ceratitis capitata TaxID=7213 RepID=W8BYJ8_CERCA|nr:unnamed protein product [Ceratitis capitata]
MSFATPTYELCTSRFCNICLFFETEKRKKGFKPTETLPADKLQFCANCRLVVYCSKEHQRFDWPIHREFCRTVAKIMKGLGVKHPLQISGQPFDTITLERNIIQLKYLLRVAMKRPLQSHEEELTSFPAYCEICYKFDKLQICNVCMAVSYCSPEHKALDKQRHNNFCAKLKLYYCPYKCQLQLPIQTLIGDLDKPVRNMVETDLLGAFQEMTSKNLPLDPTASMEAYHLFAGVCDFSCVGTICFALQFTKMNEYTPKKFVIFIVGATTEQDISFKPIHTKWFFLQYPQIKNLELYFIGPEVVGSDKNFSISCQGVERTVTCKSFCMLFQDFLKKYIIRPQLIVAFNCGFSANDGITKEGKIMTNKFAGVPGDGFPKIDPWVDGISQIIHSYGTPIIFTSYTRLEATLDYGALLNIATADCLTTNVKRLFDIRHNPYRDIRPFRNWQETFEDTIFYRNNYVQAVITHATRK